jgi:nucleotide-binding universal stress UspA family protein
MYKKILVPVDGSEPSRLGLAEAINIAKSQGSQLRLLHIVNEFTFRYTYSPMPYSNNFIDAIRIHGLDVLDRAEKQVRDAGLIPERKLMETIGGTAAEGILEEAKNCGADLIVMGTHGRRGLVRLALGSDAQQVVQAAATPVLLVRSSKQRDSQPTTTVVRVA